jgi:hypothetical protein
MRFWSPDKIVLHGDELGSADAAAADAVIEGMGGELAGEVTAVTGLNRSGAIAEERWVVWPCAGDYDYPVTKVVQRMAKRASRSQYS